MINKPKYGLLRVFGITLLLIMGIITIVISSSTITNNKIITTNMDINSINISGNVNLTGDLYSDEGARLDFDTSGVVLRGVRNTPTGYFYDNDVYLGPSNYSSTIHLRGIVNDNSAIPLLILQNWNMSGQLRMMSQHHISFYNFNNNLNVTMYHDGTDLLIVPTLNERLRVQTDIIASYPNRNAEIKLYADDKEKYIEIEGDNRSSFIRTNASDLKFASGTGRNDFSHNITDSMIRIYQDVRFGLNFTEFKQMGNKSIIYSSSGQIIFNNTNINITQGGLFINNINGSGTRFLCINTTGQVYASITGCN